MAYHDKMYRDEEHKPCDENWVNAKQRGSASARNASCTNDIVKKAHDAARKSEIANQHMDLRYAYY